jgi:hypothetical protein
MFDRKEQSDGTLDLMEEVTNEAEAITLQDFLDLTSNLPKDTPLFALVVDDDEIEYAKHVVSAAVRIERNKTGEPAKRIELKLEPDI